MSATSVTFAYETVAIESLKLVQREFAVWQGKHREFENQISVGTLTDVCQCKHARSRAITYLIVVYLLKDHAAWLTHNSPLESPEVASRKYYQL